MYPIALVLSRRFSGINYVSHCKVRSNMRTIYLVKSPSNNICFDSNPELGLHFIEASVDVTFLNNVVFDGRLKILVNQRSADQFIGMASIWFILFDDNPLSNKSLEDAFALIKNIGHQLFKVTRLGQGFSYKDIYTIPNVNDSWKIEDTFISYSDNGGFKEIYCLDRASPIEQDGEDTIFHANGKTVKADLAFVVGSDEQKTQAQFVHVTMPSRNINIDTSGLRTTGDLSPLQHFHGVDASRSAKGLIFELYNAAITSANILTSYLLLYQIVEVVISEGTASTLDDDAISGVLDVVRGANLLDDEFFNRLRGLLKGLKKENSQELLRSGIRNLLVSEHVADLDYSAFSSWRSFRGKITHPMRTQELTDIEFTVNYKSLRKFADKFTTVLP